MSNTRDIKQRIKSIGSIKKVTGAMQMVAAAKMRKAVEAALRTRTYANLSWATVLNLAKAAENETVQNPLFTQRREIKKVGIILITSNRGLCGGFNSALIKKVRESIIKHPGPDNEPFNTEFILLGRKGAAVYRYFGYNIIADFPKDDLIDDMVEAMPAAKMAMKDYFDGKYDKIFVAYADFINPVKQIPRIRQLLPIDERAHKDFLGIISKHGVEMANGMNGNGKTEYLFEPSRREVLTELVPRLIEVQIYQAMLESNASEHSARMAAMQQATDAAGELVDELTLSYNKARQANITREIAEISAGANAIGK